jgi:hypothetical protein
MADVLGSLTTKKNDEKKRPVWALDAVLGQAKEAADGKQPTETPKTFLDTVLDYFKPAEDTERTKRPRRLQR